MNNEVLHARNAVAIKTTDSNKALHLANELALDLTNKFCKEYCFENRQHYKCTLDKNWGSKSIGVTLCQWGYDSIQWIQADLLNEMPSNNLEESSNFTLPHYLSKIANSATFKERWKEWRFRQRIRLPNYLKALDPDACRVFWKLCDNDSVLNIAKELARDPLEINDLVKNILSELRARNKFHELNLLHLVSLTSTAVCERQEAKNEFISEDSFNADQKFFSQVQSAFSQLAWKEQFILEVMIIDQLDAKSVLTAIKEQGISIVSDIASEETSVNQIYSFRNKSLSKLKDLLNTN